MIRDQLIQNATSNIKDILKLSIKFNPAKESALVVFDTQNELTNIITQAYRNELPKAQFVDFDLISDDKIKDQFGLLKPNDLVVLIQTSSFRLNDYRIRINLFNQGLKVIEHMHLHRNPRATWESYIASLEYDQSWYHAKGKRLQQTLSQAVNFTIVSKDKAGQEARLNVEGGLEVPKLNIGDYTDMKTIGGTFPIGEVFTEAKVLENLSGSFWIYAFADRNFEIVFPEIFRVDVSNGIISNWSDNAPKEFVAVVAMINEQERAIVREIGFGLNRGIDRENPLGDITAFERVIGVHLSIGEKHSVYKKQGIAAHKARFHIDLFVATDQVVVDGKVIFKNGGYSI